ncbi:hypothetical protein F4780DRAFT_780557 [Xylariomycetidae sp. FL0641]|nr:hypothetical protein F4780DRAFT_780557 [Xylariomycetidae sp. FL0641]
MAGFMNSFGNMTQGSDLQLRWAAGDSAASPSIVVYTRLLNRTGDHTANSLELNITVQSNTTTSYLWENVPSPLPYLETAMYEVEVRPQQWTDAGSRAPVFAASSFFSIAEAHDDELSDDEETDDSDTDDEPSTSITNVSVPIASSKPMGSSHSGAGINNNAAIAAGLIAPVIVALAVFGLIWVQRRQRKMLEQKRKQREELTID